MAVAIDKYTCPFCGQKAIFIGVHDNEGNYEGRPGCEYELDPCNGLSYAIHHDGLGDCILCTDGHDMPLGHFFDTAEEVFQAISTLTQPNEDGKDKNVPTNDPLTLEELTLMIEPTPVWWDWVQGWVLARKGMILSWNGVYYNFEEVKGNFYRCPLKEVLTCEGCVHEINEHENCNYCIRADYLGDYYYRSQDVLKNE